MKNLYLVRHAKSSWKFPHLADFDRPLNGRGKRDAPEMGRRLKAREIEADLMVSSPAKRAFTTAMEIAKALGYPEENILTDHNIYHAGTPDLMGVIRTFPDQKSHALIFGHNPGFTDLANQLLDEYFDNIPTCGIVGINFNTPYWVSIDHSNSRMLFYDYPKKLN